MEMVSMYQGIELTKEDIDKIKLTPLTLIPNVEWVSAKLSQKRLKCAYCDCINNKDFGTCDYCGAPLKLV